MSSERQVRILSAEYLRFPEEGSSAQGKSGPKPRASAVGDGQLVEIPAPPKAVMSDAVTQEEESSVPLVVHVQASSVIMELSTHGQAQGVMGREILVPKRCLSHCQEKPLTRP